MSEIKPGDRVRVVRDLYPDAWLVDDLIGWEGTTVDTDVRRARLGLGALGHRAEPLWIRVHFTGRTELFHPDELEVIEP